MRGLLRLAVPANGRLNEQTHAAANATKRGGYLPFFALLADSWTEFQENLDCAQSKVFLPLPAGIEYCCAHGLVCA